jgi:Flp pilus assembly protein TadG
MLQNLINDKRGVSELVSTACMLLIIFLLAGIILQLIAVGTAQLAVTVAAFSAARAATRSETPYDTAVDTARHYGNGFLKDWQERITVNFLSPETLNPGNRITVEVSYPVPPLFSEFPPPIVKGVSTQVMEELP